MAQLNERDTQFCVARLNPQLRHLMQTSLGGVTVVAGGFVRSVISGETVNDIDVFVANDTATSVIVDLLKLDKFSLSISPNAKTLIKDNRTPIQIITRWMFGDSEKHRELRSQDNAARSLSAAMMLQEVIQSFDFTVCQAGIVCVENKWIGICADAFYADLCAKRLVYTKPDRDEDAGGSMLRMLKYTARGYRPTLPSIAAISARLFMGKNDVKLHGNGTVQRIDFDPGAKGDPPYQSLTDMDEDQVAKMLEERLVEIDPPIDVSLSAFVP